MGANYDLALRQKDQFQRGHLRIKGTRELDPVVVLEIRDKDGGGPYFLQTTLNWTIEAIEPAANPL